MEERGWTGVLGFPYLRRYSRGGSCHAPKPAAVSSHPSEAPSDRGLKLGPVHAVPPKNLLLLLQAYLKEQLGALLYPFLGLHRV